MVRLGNVIICVLLFSMAVAGSFVAIKDVGEAYNVTVNTTFNETTNKVDEMYETSANMKESITSSGGFASTAYTLLIKGTWFVLQQIISVTSTIFVIIKEIFQTYGIPSWFGYGIMGVILTTIVIAVVSTALQKDI